MYYQLFLTQIFLHASWLWSSSLSTIFYLMPVHYLLSHLCPQYSISLTTNHSWYRYSSIPVGFGQRVYPQYSISWNTNPSCHVALVIVSVHNLLLHVLPIIPDTDIPSCYDAKLFVIFSLDTALASLPFQLLHCHDIFQFSYSQDVPIECGLSFDASTQFSLWVDSVFVQLCCSSIHFTLLYMEQNSFYFI